MKYSVGPGHPIPVHRATRLYLKRSVLGAGNGGTVILTVFIKYFLCTFLQRRQSTSDGVRSPRRWPNVKNSSSTWTKLRQKKVYQWLTWVVLMEAHPTFVWRSSKTIRLTSWHWTVDVFMKQVQALFVKCWRNFLGLDPVVKRKKKNVVLCSCTPKWTHEIRKFHVGVVQRQLRNVRKTWYVHSFFAYRNLFTFCHSRCRRRSRCLSCPLLWSRNFATMATWRLFSSLLSGQ